MDLYSFGLTQIATFVLVLARVGGIFTSAPVFGNVHVAPRIRVAIALALAFVFLPLAKYPEPRVDFLPFAFAVLKEAAIGVAMGFVVSLVFAAIQMAGAYIDLLAGFGFADIVDPMVREHNAVVGQLQNLAATLLFLAVNGHHLVIRGLADSFSVIPLGAATFSPAAAEGMMQVFIAIFAAALKIAAPVVGAIFLTDVSLGILARTVPQLNVFVVGFPAKLAVVLFAVVAVMPLAFGVMSDLFTGIHRDLLALFRYITI